MTEIILNNDNDNYTFISRIYKQFFNAPGEMTSEMTGEICENDPPPP